jgi:hypothetical protein
MEQNRMIVRVHRRSIEDDDYHNQLAGKRMPAKGRGSREGIRVGGPVRLK